MLFVSKNNILSILIQLIFHISSRLINEKKVSKREFLALFVKFNWITAFERERRIKTRVAVYIILDEEIALIEEALLDCVKAIWCLRNRYEPYRQQQWFIKTLFLPLPQKRSKHARFQPLDTQLSRRLNEHPSISVWRILSLNLIDDCQIWGGYLRACDSRI